LWSFKTASFRRGYVVVEFTREIEGVAGIERVERMTGVEVKKGVTGIDGMTGIEGKKVRRRQAPTQVRARQ
jgi:hypothetical protein